MTKRKPQIEKSDSAEADLRAALGRLRRGQPIHPDHVKLKAEGRLRISVASVAREAGRSRTLIGTNECVYLALRNEVLVAVQAQVPLQGEKVANLTAQDTIKGLREENNLLRQERAALATRVLEAVNVARSLEKKLVAATKEADRVRARQSNPDKLVGRTLAGTNVVALHGGD